MRWFQGRYFSLSGCEEHDDVEQYKAGGDQNLDLRKRTSAVFFVNLALASERRCRKIGFEFSKHGVFGAVEFAVGRKERRPGKTDNGAARGDRPQPNSLWGTPTAILSD